MCFVWLSAFSAQGWLPDFVTGTAGSLRVPLGYSFAVTVKMLMGSDGISSIKEVLFSISAEICCSPFPFGKLLQDSAGLGAVAGNASLQLVHSDEIPSFVVVENFLFSQFSLYSSPFL